MDEVFACLVIRVRLSEVERQLKVITLNKVHFTIKIIITPVDL